LHKEYTTIPPKDWIVADKYKKIIEFGATINQCYWHYNKIMSA
jgi:hypothetical protein